MGRPKGSKNAKAATGNGSTAVLERPPQRTIEIEEQPDLVLTIRRIKVGSFQGLWELARVNADGTIKVISDANTKSLIISLARNEILRCGQ